MLGTSGKCSEPLVSSGSLTFPLLPSVFSIPSILIGEERKMLCPAVVFGTRCDRREMCQVPLILHRKVFNSGAQLLVHTCADLSVVS